MRHWNREYWYLIAIAIISFIALCLAVWIQFSKATNFLAKWLFIFLSEWAMVLGPAVMLLLAGAAFWAIMDNRHSQLKDLKRRSLDEIRSWAQDAFQVLSPTGKYLLVDSADRDKMEVSLRSVAAQSISAITDANEFGGKLKENVDRAATNLNVFIEKLRTEKGNWADSNTEWENLKNNFLDVIGTASELRAKTTLKRF